MWEKLDTEKDFSGRFTVSASGDTKYFTMHGSGQSVLADSAWAWSGK